jgi:uncharacterized protein YbjT (DUF2867 family)
MRIAVAGAAGRVGRHVMDELTTEGDDLVPISRSSGVDVVTGEGLAAALRGVEGRGRTHCRVDASADAERLSRLEIPALSP